MTALCTVSFPYRSALPLLILLLELMIRHCYFGVLERIRLSHLGPPQFYVSTTLDNVLEEFFPIIQGDKLSKT